MADPVQIGSVAIRRGNKAQLPTLPDGQFGLCEDTKQLFIGSLGGNIGLASVLNGGYKIQMGGANIVTSAAAGNYGSAITFPTAFSAVPYIFVVTQKDNAPSILPAATTNLETASGFSAYIEQKDATARTVAVLYIAFGT